MTVGVISRAVVKYNHNERKAKTLSGGRDRDLKECLLVYQFRTAAAVSGYLQGAPPPRRTKVF